jgi:hypothetical protein
MVICIRMQRSFFLIDQCFRHQYPYSRESRRPFNCYLDFSHNTQIPAVLYRPIVSGLPIYKHARTSLVQ